MTLTLTRPRPFLPVQTGADAPPALSPGAQTLLSHLRQHGPQTVGQLHRAFPLARELLGELRAAWLVFTAQGDGTRTGRHGLVLAAPPGAACSPCALAALHAQVRGQRGTLGHFARQWDLSPGDALWALCALRAQGLASGAVTGATLAAWVHPEASALKSVTPVPPTLQAWPA